MDRKTAAETCGMDRQTLRDWVHPYNAAGLAGLRNAAHTVERISPKVIFCGRFRAGMRH